MKKILLVGSIGAQNLGDDLLLENVAKIYAHHTLYLFSKKASLSIAHEEMAPFPFGIRSFLSFSWVKTFVALKGIDKVIFIGGGLWDDHEGTKGPWMWLFYYLIFNFYKKDILLLGQSFSIRSSKFQNIFSFCLKYLCDPSRNLWYFRDIVSFKNFRNIFLRMDTRIGVDSIFFEDFRTQKKPDLMRVENLLVNIHYSSPLSQAREILKYAKIKNKKIILVSTDKKDVEFYEKYFPSYERVWISNKQDLEKFHGNSAVIAMRLHLAILTLEWPQWIIAYSNKVSDFFHETWVKSVHEPLDFLENEGPLQHWDSKQDFLQRHFQKALAVLKDIRV